MPGAPEVAERVQALKKRIEDGGSAKAELAAIRKAAQGKIEGGMQGDAETDNEAGNNPAEGAAQPKISDIGKPNDEQSLVDAEAKELTPAQKAARNLAGALGLLPETKEATPPTGPFVFEGKEIDVSNLTDGEKNKLLKALSALGSAAAITGGTATTVDAVRRKRERERGGRGKLRKIQAVLEGKKESQRPTFLWERKNLIEDPDYNGVPGVQDPQEMERIKNELNLSPQEAAIFDEVTQEGAGVESVDAGESAAPAPEEAQAAPAAPEAPPMEADPNKPSSGMEMFQPEGPKPALPGQGPVETNPGADQAEAPPQERPEGSGAFQGSPEGEETSQAAPQFAEAPVAHASPGASKHTVEAPPMDPQETQTQGQTEDEAFQSLVQKLERFEEQMQPGGKSLEYDDKGVARILAKLAKRAVGMGRQASSVGQNAIRGAGNRAAQFGSRNAARPGAAGIGARAVQRGGQFAARNPRAAAVAGAGAAGAAGGAAQAIRDDRRGYY